MGMGNKGLRELQEKHMSSSIIRLRDSLHS